LCRGNLTLVAYSFFGTDTQKTPRPHIIFRIAFVQRPRDHVRCCKTGTIHLPYTSHTPPTHHLNRFSCFCLHSGWYAYEVYVRSMWGLCEVSNETSRASNPVYIGVSENHGRCRAKIISFPCFIRKLFLNLQPN
jgi:hypothetical protein